jgi:hypothetical protein
MRGEATEVNETQKWATSKKRLRTTALHQWFSSFFGSRCTVKRLKNFLAHFMYKIKNILIYFKL